MNREMIIERMQEGCCPFCNQTGLKLPARHVFEAHGLSSSELRERFGINRTQRLCPPEFSEACADRPQNIEPGHLPSARGRNWKARDQRREVLRKAGKLVSREHLSRMGHLSSGTRGMVFVPYEHGTEGRYRKGCKCKLCKTAHADVYRAYRISGRWSPIA